MQIENTKLILSASRALWGNITPNVRKVSISESNKIIYLYFYYENAPSDLEIELSEDTMTEVIADFPQPYGIESKREVIKCPNKIPFQGCLVYSRYEPF